MPFSKPPFVTILVFDGVGVDDGLGDDVGVGTGLGGGAGEAEP